jgi:hypothetical protein
MVRDLATGRFLYTERLERRRGETSWEYVRRSVRREAHIRTQFSADTQQVIMGWGAESVEDFLKSYPEYGPAGDGRPDGLTGEGPERPEGETIDG